jgi:hypothetical protein
MGDSGKITPNLDLASTGHTTLKLNVAIETIQTFVSRANIQKKRLRL